MLQDGKMGVFGFQSAGSKIEIRWERFLNSYVGVGTMKAHIWGQVFRSNWLSIAKATFHGWSTA